jgi:hypothetical protein
MLSDAERMFLHRLLGRRLPPGSPDPSLAPWPEWQGYYLALCRDGAEPAVIEGIFAKVPPTADPSAAAIESSLCTMLLELAALLPREMEEEVPGPGQARSSWRSPASGFDRRPNFLSAGTVGAVRAGRR